jgi:hypothetical protein
VFVGEGRGTTTLVVAVGVAMKPGVVGAGQGVAPLAIISLSMDSAVGLGEAVAVGAIVAVTFGAVAVGVLVDVTWGAGLGEAVAVARAAVAVATTEVGDGVEQILTASGTWRGTLCLVR